MKGSGFSSWPTAQTVYDGRTDEALIVAKARADRKRKAGEYAKGCGTPSMMDLQRVAQSWPTPMAGTPAQNGNSAAGNNDFTRRAEELALSMWATPDTPSGGRTLPPGTSATGMAPDGRKVTVGLENQAQMWGTPRGSDGEKGGPNMSFGSGGTPLPAQAAKWPTPNAHQDTRGAQASMEAVIARDGKHQHALSDVALVFSRPAPETWAHGRTPLPTIRLSRRLFRSATSRMPAATLRRLSKQETWTKRRLNPLFVEWLMGFPIGLSLCDCSATEWSRYVQLMRGELSHLPTASAAWIWEPPIETDEPMQMELI